MEICVVTLRLYSKVSGLNRYKLKQIHADIHMVTTFFTKVGPDDISKYNWDTRRLYPLIDAAYDRSA